MSLFTPPESTAEAYTNAVDFNALNNPLFDLADFDLERDLSTDMDIL